MNANNTLNHVSLLVAEGDGIGPEICRATRLVLEAVASAHDLRFTFATKPIGFAALETCGTTFPHEVLDAARNADGVILGPISHNEYPPAAEGGRNPSGELRTQLDLFANIRPARSYPGLLPRCGKPLDLVIVRENTEGFYADRTMFLGPGEMMPTPDLAMAFRKVTRAASLRIARVAFALAADRRKRVTAVHKANVLRISDGLFLECVRQVAAEFPDITYEEKLVDAMAALLIRDPTVYDVIVTTNMFGDILSDEASELCGSLGLAASLNAGEQHALAQAQHGSAPDLAGQDKANPASLIGSAAMLLKWIGERRGNDRLISAGQAIEGALAHSIETVDGRTADLGGPLGTRAFAESVAELSAQLPAATISPPRVPNLAAVSLLTSHAGRPVRPK